MDTGDSNILINVGKEKIPCIMTIEGENYKNSLKVSNEETNMDGIWQSVGNKSIQIMPFGRNNDFPETLAKELGYKAKELLRFSEDQIWGKGPILYDTINKTEADRNKAEVKQIIDWLDSWNWKIYLQSEITDYIFCQNCYSEILVTKGAMARVKNVKTIAELKHAEAKWVRLEVKNEKGIIKHAILGDWETHRDFQILPMWDRNNPEQSPISLFHAKRKVANYSYYSYPDYPEIFETWQPVAERIPTFHKALLDNGINAKYHITIANEYIEQVRKDKEAELLLNGDTTTRVSSLEALDFVKSQISQKLGEVMSGADNAGKFFLSNDVLDVNGNIRDMIKIEPIDNQIKELSESHLKLNEQVNSEYCSAFGVDPALASIYIGGKMSSGSEILNSYNVHQQSKTEIPRMIICQAINEAIKINWGNLPYEVKFENTFLVKQEDNKTGVAKEDEK